MLDHVKYDYGICMGHFFIFINVDYQAYGKHTRGLLHTQKVMEAETVKEDRVPGIKGVYQEVKVCSQLICLEVKMCSQ